MTRFSAISVVNAGLLREREQLLLLRRAAGLLRERAHGPARGRRGELDVAREQLAHEHRRLAGNHLAGSAAAADDDELVEPEGEPLRRPGDERRRVLGEHLEVIADRVAHALREPDLEVALRAAERRAEVDELAALVHLHRDEAVRGREVPLRAGEPLDLERGHGVARLELREPERLADGGEDAPVPGLEVSEEVRARVRLAARVQPGRAGPGEPLVDPLRHRLVGRGPVAAAAAEDRVADARERSAERARRPTRRTRRRCPAACRCTRR